MGKIRKSRMKRNKSSDGVVVSDQEVELAVDSKENAIQTILDQLQAANVEEKYCGLQTFSMLIESPENVEQVLNNGLVKVVAPLLLDPATSVRNGASGALRNLSTTSPDVCNAMMDQDTMSPLTMYFHERAENWTPDPGSKDNDDRDTFVHCVHLLLNLCENSELAIKYLCQSRILDILPRYLDIPTFGEDIVIATLQCLFVVLEDNLPAMEKIKSNSETQLQTLLLLEGSNPSALLIKTLTAGVIISTCGGNIGSLPSNTIHQIVSLLANTLSVDHRLVCNQLSSSVPLNDGAGTVPEPEGKAAKVLQNQLKAVTQMLDAQQSAIEIIANICSCEDGDDSESGNSSDSEEICDDEINDIGLDGTVGEDKLPAEVMEALISLEIFDKVWARTQLPAENVMMILQEYDESKVIHKKLHNLQSGALLCINNMLSTLPVDNLGGINGVYKIWTDAGKIVFKHNSDNLILVESATAVMRAALDKMKMKENGNATGHALFNDLALSDIEIMLTGIRECQVPEIRSNLIRMIGLLALLLVSNLNDTTSNVICAITEFILEQAHKENEVWVLAEAVDTLVDLYSEDETDGLAARVKLVEKLAALAPVLRNKSRQQRRLPKEYKVLVSTASSNLPRFIKYKSARVKNIK